jgi:hypothetical protein
MPFFLLTVDRAYLCHVSPHVLHRVPRSMPKRPCTYMSMYTYILFVHVLDMYVSYVICDTHTHTHTHIDIDIDIYLCVCVCILPLPAFFLSFPSLPGTRHLGMGTRSTWTFLDYCTRTRWSTIFKVRHPLIITLFVFPLRFFFWLVMIIRSITR